MRFTDTVTFPCVPGMWVPSPCEAWRGGGWLPGDRATEPEGATELGGVTVWGGTELGLDPWCSGHSPPPVSQGLGEKVRGAQQAPLRPPGNG